MTMECNVRQSGDVTILDCAQHFLDVLFWVEGLLVLEIEGMHDVSLRARSIHESSRESATSRSPLPVLQGCSQEGSVEHLSDCFGIVQSAAYRPSRNQENRRLNT